MGKVKISELPSASSLTGREVLPVVQGGSTLGATVNQIKDKIQASAINVLKMNASSVQTLANIGELAFNPDTQTLEVKCSADVTLSIGQENYIRGKNAEAYTILNGTVVYVSGGQGANSLIKRAGNADGTAERVIGVATQNIGANNIGFITTNGVVNKLNTSAYLEGDLLWLGTNGAMTNVKPDTSVDQICIGVVLRAHATEGSLLVAVKDDWRDKLAEVRSDLNTSILKKSSPNIIWSKVSSLYSEKTATTDNGLVNGSTALSSGYILVDTGDIINLVNGYSNAISFYNSDKTSRLSVNIPATAPSGYPFAVIMYGYNNIGGYEDAYVQIVPADSAKKIGYNAINFVSQQAVNNPLLVESAKISWERYLQQSAVVQGTNLFNKKNVVNGFVNYSSNPGVKIDIAENANFVTSKIIVKDLSAITVKGIRAITFSDSDDNILAVGALINNTISTTISIPAGSFYCYVSIYATNNDLNIAQVNEGGVLLSYEDYKFDLKFNGKLLIYELQESLKSLQNNDVIIQSLFEYGTITGAGELSNDIIRIRSRFSLKDGVKYSFSLSSKSGANLFSELATFYENSSGQIISNGGSTEITGTSSVVAFWFVAKKTAGGAILNWEKDDCILLANYSDDIIALIDDLQIQMNAIDEELVDVDKQLNVENTILKNENSSLKEQLNFQNERMISLSSYKINTSDADTTLQLNRITGGKLILNLHKRANDGYYENNNIYFPNCRTDFSDVSIKDNNGNTLPFRFIYRGNIDIIPDQRLSNVQLINKDSFGNSYSGKDGKVKKSSDGCITWNEISIFNDLSSPDVSLISNTTDTMFVGSKGKLYRSEYPYSTKTMVLDFNVYHANSIVLSHSMVQHPDGDLFIGSYQKEFDARIFKSTDNGVTWSQVYQTTAYQHVHNMSIDINQSPIAIYAGLDGGGAILKTTDKGISWNNLRTLNPSIPQSTDYGIIYSDQSGYRLSGGETSIVGGHSILKTNDDITFKPVLSCGKAVYFVEKLNNKLFAGALSSRSFRNTAILVSEDEGETWKTAYFTENFNDGGASDGYRYLSKCSFDGIDFLIAGIQSNSRLPLRILSDSDSYFASILVEIPSGCEQITVGDGYILSNEKQIINDSSDLNRKLYIGLNEDNAYISIDENGSKSLIKKGFLFSDCGKKLGEIYPPIVSYAYQKSAKIPMLNYFEVNNIDLSNGNFSIGFWMKSDEYSYQIELLKSNNFSLAIVNGYQLHLNGYSISSFGSPIVFGVMNRVDIGLSSSGVITVYLNGILKDTYNSTSSIYADLNKFYVLNVLYRKNGNADTVIQNFSIREGVVTQEEANNNYYSKIFDNI